MPHGAQSAAAVGTAPAPTVVEVRLGDCVAGMRVLPDASVDLIIADPPYDISVQGSRWDSVPDYLNWSRTWLAQARRLLRPGGQLFIYGSPAKLWISRLKIIAADEFGFDFKQHISWCYTQGGDSRFVGMQQYSVRMEHVEWFVVPGAAGSVAHTFNAHAAAEPYSAEERATALAKGVGRVTDESLDKGRPPRNWVEIPRENSRSVERKYGAHPSMKPLKLCERIVGVHSHEADCVLVPFGGSGSECVAAAKMRRRVIAFENDPQYHAIIVRRLAGHGVGVDAAAAAAAAAFDTAAAAAASAAHAGVSSAAASAPGHPLAAASAAANAVTDIGPLERSTVFTSGFKGVFRHGKKFVAKIRIDGRLVPIGTFDNALEAAVAYQARAAEHAASAADGGPKATTPLPPPPFEGGGGEGADGLAADGARATKRRRRSAGIAIPAPTERQAPQPPPPPAAACAAAEPALALAQQHWVPGADALGPQLARHESPPSQQHFTAGKHPSAEPAPSSRPPLGAIVVAGVPSAPPAQDHDSDVPCHPLGAGSVGTGVPLGPAFAHGPPASAPPPSESHAAGLGPAPFLAGPWYSHVMVPAFPMQMWR